MVQIYEVIGQFILAISTILSILLIIRFNKLRGLLKVVGIYIIVGTAIDIVSAAQYHKVQNNLKFLHLFTLFELVIISHLFNSLFQYFKSKINLKYIAIPATAFVIINSLLIQNIETYNTYSSILTSIIIIGFCIHFFLLILEYQTPNFGFIIIKWFIICLFFFHSISLIVTLFGGLLQDISRDVRLYVWGFRLVIILATKIILASLFFKLLLFNSNLKSHE